MKPKFTTALRDDVMALMDYFIEVKKGEGENWSQSKIAVTALGTGSFIKAMKEWKMGGSKSPTLESVARFESWLHDQLGKEAYEAFRLGRIAAKTKTKSGE